MFIILTANYLTTILFKHSFNLTQKKEFLEDFISVIKSKHPIAKQTIDLIIKNMDPNSDGDGNVDNINGNIDASDILVDVINIITTCNSQGLSLLIEQLEDTMALGPCVQGRVVRLYQLYKAFEN